MAKLTEEQRREIVILVATYELERHEAGERYGVSRQEVSDLCLRPKWRGLFEAEREAWRKSIREMPLATVEGQIRERMELYKLAKDAIPNDDKHGQAAEYANRILDGLGRMAGLEDAPAVLSILAQVQVVGVALKPDELATLKERKALLLAEGDGGGQVLEGESQPGEVDAGSDGESVPDPGPAGDDGGGER